MSWELILPFLEPIAPLLKDPGISDILINGGNRVFIERNGVVLAVEGIALTEKMLQVALRHIARTLDDDINQERPLLDARLPDGSRVAAVLAPCSIGGTTVAIRKFRPQRFTAEELVASNTLPAHLLAFLTDAVRNHQNILISGGTGSGKTTLLGALASFIPPEERIVVIEDTAELSIDAKNLVRLEARREQAPIPAVTIRDLLKTTLRLRPDRILLGEVRGGEAFDLLQALNTGHAGTLSTLHATSAAQALARFTTCVLLAGIDLPYKAVRSNIGDALDIVVHIERYLGRRRVQQACRVKAYNSDQDRFELESIYEWSKPHES